MDISATLVSKYPGTQWLLTGDSYEGLEWLGNTPKPTKKQLEDSWTALQAELQAKADAKVSAIAKLEALGLTVNEVEAAFGLSE